MGSFRHQHKHTPVESVATLPSKPSANIYWHYSLRESPSQRQGKHCLWHSLTVHAVIVTYCCVIHHMTRIENSFNQSLLNSFARCRSCLNVFFFIFYALFTDFLGNLYVLLFSFPLFTNFRTHSFTIFSLVTFFLFLFFFSTTIYFLPLV